MSCKREKKITLTTEPCIGTRERISIDYPFLHEEIQVGQRILINDGLVSLVVEKKLKEKNIHCSLIEEGVLLPPRKGVNLPEVPLRHLSSFTEKDKRDLAFASRTTLTMYSLFRS